MGDNDGNKPDEQAKAIENQDSVPDNRSEASIENNTEQQTVPDSTTPSPPEDINRAATVEQAKKFLQEDDVRNRSTDEKRAFLKSKGLESHQVQTLLDQTQSQSQLQSQPQPQSRPAVQRVRETPPIITYPEFLTVSPSPPPLITKQRLLTTLYLFGGLSALLYGTNEHLVQPMIASLTTSRISLAETAKDNLQKLVEKLEQVVSDIPSPSSESVAAEESDEDPTEMFHRDIGVQTSFSPTPTRPRSPEPTSLDTQVTMLQRLNTGCSTLLDESKSEEQENSDLTATVRILKEYLEELAYPALTYGYGAYNSGSGDNDDEIGRVKQQIRGVKGVLLSSRSFPGGARSVR
ncbi:peroxin 14/17 [Phlyctema vagabunda]|uniref:Peroxisomal membrane protein PEX14 n=1 Tax=Phlyctema vagabunda TaxID=108571 RepID=A0ABR4PF62_9HELO